jgi:phosphate starvation-inducible PhoH-like protein
MYVIMCGENNNFNKFLLKTTTFLKSEVVLLFEQIINFDRMEQAVNLFGNFDENIKLIEKKYDVNVVCRGADLKISGDAENVSLAVRAINGLLNLINKGEALTEQNVRYVTSLVDDGDEEKLSQMSGDCICITTKGKPVKPKTLGQEKYVQAIEDNTVVLGIGPAGTGKTYLAVAMAVRAFRAKEVNRIILTRPAVEAGEKLGFLPGDLQQKVDPYLRPLYDALFDMLGAENFQKYQERGSIEVAPLAYMRGRTLDDSFIILDEAQNTTAEQMKMFLTRLGFNSKMVVTGDITQIDLPEGKRSGLIEATKILKNVDDIRTIHFTEKDVVRHKLVQDIIKAYEKFEEAKKRNDR